MQKNYTELSFILIVGILQPIIEVLMGMQAATYYNGIAIIVVLAYIILRLVQQGKSLFITWGFRLDTLQKSIAPYALVVALSSGILYTYGWYNNFTPLPVGFWYVLGIYPIWGLAQQFVLQNFVARNLVTLFPSLIIRSAVTAIIFACAHIPSSKLMAVTLVGGFVFTYMHNTYQNLWALAIAHGILGAFVFHLVLGQDQWSILVRYFS